MKVRAAESRMAVIAAYRDMVNKLSSYHVTDDNIFNKVSACIELMGNYDIEIFITACNEWIEKEISMPTPKKLSLKCYDLAKRNREKITGEISDVCEMMRIRKKSGIQLLECEEEICEKSPVNFHFNDSSTNTVKSMCSFHSGIVSNKKAGEWRSGHLNCFSTCKNPVMSYIESEIFIHKYLKSDTMTKSEMLETLDSEHQEALKKHEKNLDEESCIRSSVTSVFKSIDKF
jgi:hypothetical protein